MYMDVDGRQLCLKFPQIKNRAIELQIKKKKRGKNIKESKEERKREPERKEPVMLILY